MLSKVIALAAILSLAAPGVARADFWLNVVTNGDDAIGVTGHGSCNIVGGLQRSPRKQTCTGAGSVSVSRMPAKYVNSWGSSGKHYTASEQVAATRKCVLSIWKSGSGSSTEWHIDFGPNDEKMCRTKWLNGNTLELFVSRSSESQPYSG